MNEPSVKRINPDQEKDIINRLYKNKDTKPKRSESENKGSIPAISVIAMRAKKANIIDWN
jgi:hypothetical protein